MDPLIGVVTVLLLASTLTFFCLSIADRRIAESAVPSGPAVTLDDLVGKRHPLFPHTIRQTPLD
jgi:hypothetical protein